MGACCSSFADVFCDRSVTTITQLENSIYTLPLVNENFVYFVSLVDQKETFYVNCLDTCKVTIEEKLSKSTCLQTVLKAKPKHTSTARHVNPII